MFKILTSLLLFTCCFLLKANDAVVQTRSTTLSPFQPILPTQKNAKARQSHASCSEMRIHCFDDAIFNVELTQEKLESFGVKVQSGKIQSSEFDNMVYIQNGSQIYCTINDYQHNMLYTITSKDGQIFTITKEDKSLRKERIQSQISPKQTLHNDFVNQNFASPLPIENFLYIDIMITYDATANIYLKKKNISSLSHANMLIAQANSYLKNSNITTFEFRLARTFPSQLQFDKISTNGATDFNQKTYSRLNKLLNIMQSGQSKAALDIRNARKSSGADIVVAIVYTGSDYGYVGISYALEKATSIKEFANVAFSVVNAASDAETFAHEIGHMMGAGHAMEQHSAPGPQRFNYSAGYYIEANQEHTLMAYNLKYSGGRIYKSLPVFSSPNVYSNGHQAGSEYANNARTLIEIAPYTSRYMAESNFSENPLKMVGSIGSYEDRIRLSWKKPIGIKYFNLFDENNNLILKTTNSSYTLKTIEDKAFHAYKIISYDSNDNPYYTDTAFAVIGLQTNTQWVTDSIPVWRGARIDLLAENMPLSGSVIAKTPAFHIRYIDPFSQKIKKMAIKSHTKISTQYQRRDFMLEYNVNTNCVNRRLINPYHRQYKSISDLILDSQMTLCSYLFIKYDFAPFAIQSHQKFDVQPPSITNCIRNKDPIKNKEYFDLTGLYFGSKKPKAFLEYSSKNKLKKRALAVLSRPSYPNIMGEINQFYTDAQTGESSVLLSCRQAKHNENYIKIVIDNGAAFTTIDLPAPQ